MSAKIAFRAAFVPSAPWCHCHARQDVMAPPPTYPMPARAPPRTLAFLHRLAATGRGRVWQALWHRSQAVVHVSRATPDYLRTRLVPQRAVLH